MSGLVTLGRIFFAVLFVFSGVVGLSDIAATAQQIADRVVIPADLSVYTAQLETLAGMPFSHVMAITAGSTEIICGLMIALNFGVRFFSAVLIAFILVATFYFHNFWDMSGTDRSNNMIHALKNLSLIGALLVMIGFPRQVREDVESAEVGY